MTGKLYSRFSRGEDSGGWCISSQRESRISSRLPVRGLRELELKRAKAQLGLALFLGIRSGKGRGETPKKQMTTVDARATLRVFSLTTVQLPTPMTDWYFESTMIKPRPFNSTVHACATASSSFVVIYSSTSGDAFDDADQRACNAITWIASYISPYLRVGFSDILHCLVLYLPYLTVTGFYQSHH